VAWSSSRPLKGRRSPKEFGTSNSKS